MAEEKKKCPPGHVRMSDIVESQVAIRGVDEASEEFLELVQSVKARGVLNSILVREIKTDQGIKYGLIDGLQRFTASKHLGKDFIPANIQPIEEADVLEAQIIGNVHRIATKPAEYSQALLRIVAANPMLTIRELAKKLAKSIQWIEQRLSLTKLDENIQKLVDQDKIPLQNAYALAKLPVEEQAGFVDRAMTDKPKEFVPAAIGRAKELAAAKRQGKDAKPAGFAPVATFRPRSELQTALEDRKLATAVCEREDAKTAIDGFITAMKWAFNIDKEGVAAQKAKHDEREAKKAADKEKRKKERDAKKAEEAAEKSGDLAELLGVK